MISKGDLYSYKIKIKWILKNIYIIIFIKWRNCMFITGILLITFLLALIFIDFYFHYKKTGDKKCIFGYLFHSYYFLFKKYKKAKKEK